MKHLGLKSNPVDQTMLITGLYKLKRNNYETIEKIGHRFIQQYELCLYYKTPLWSVETLGMPSIFNLNMSQIFK